MGTVTHTLASPRWGHLGGLDTPLGVGTEGRPAKLGGCRSLSVFLPTQESRLSRLKATSDESPKKQLRSLLPCCSCPARGPWQNRLGRLLPASGAPVGLPGPAGSVSVHAGVTVTGTEGLRTWQQMLFKVCMRGLLFTTES